MVNKKKKNQKKKNFFVIRVVTYKLNVKKNFVLLLSYFSQNRDKEYFYKRKRNFL